MRFQGNWFPHRLRPAADERTFFAGDSAGHCFPLSGEGIRTAFYFGIAAGREIRAVLDGAQAARGTRCATTPRSAPRTRRAYRRALRLQRLVPALPPRVLDASALQGASSRSPTARSPGTWTRRTRVWRLHGRERRHLKKGCRPSAR